MALATGPLRNERVKLNARQPVSSSDSGVSNLETPPENGTNSLIAHAAKTVSWEDIVNDDKTTGDVLTYGLGLKAQRHSTLKTDQHQERGRRWCPPGATPSAAKSSAARRGRRWCTTA
jgi:hypothetical protein